MLERVKQQLGQKLELLPHQTPVSADGRTRYTVLGSTSPALRHRRHRRHISLSTFSPRKVAWLACTSLFLLALYCASATTYLGLGTPWRKVPLGEYDHIPLGQSVDRDGREVFWWEQFPRLNGFYRGRHDVVLPSQYVPEQKQTSDVFVPRPEVGQGLIHSTDLAPGDVVSCSFEPPIIPATDGLPQGMTSPLMGSMEELGINSKICYDRIHRYGPYGLDTSPEMGGVGVDPHGDVDRDNHLDRKSMANIKWHEVQEDCVARNIDRLRVQPRTAFILRTWHTFEYTPYHILMLRAMINELSLRSGGQIYVHFLIHVQDDSIPIWTSEEWYNETLKASLPEEFQGMATLWSVAQMKVVYPPPFPKSVVNFSGGEIYDAYRSLHFPLQYFASQHPEFDYFWQWEMDIRVTGHYGELLDKVTNWAERQSRYHLWERSAKFYFPERHNDSYAEFIQTIIEETATSGQEAISGAQLARDQLFPIPPQSPPREGHEITDLITFSPLFDPTHTQWAFHDDITGYPSNTRPPTRAALIAATRMSRRLLLLMHQESYTKKHTMFPEMFPASIALHYGLKAVYAPITTYFDRDWPAEHANEIFNNAKLSPRSVELGMDHGNHQFHGKGGSVFGPGEHVFRGSTWYSNAGFAGYLWRRWLGNENSNGEIDWELNEGNGRMCLPMMILHPIKNDA